MAARSADSLAEPPADAIRVNDIAIQRLPVAIGRSRGTAWYPAWIDGSMVSLSRRQYAILNKLIRTKGLVEHGDMISAVYGDDEPDGDP